jgi:hypothetical protein
VNDVLNSLTTGPTAKDLVGQSVFTCRYSTPSDRSRSFAAATSIRPDPVPMEFGTNYRNMKLRRSNLTISGTPTAIGTIHATISAVVEMSPALTARSAVTRAM